MNKYISLLFFCCLATFPVYSQTYQELVEKSIEAAEKDSLIRAEEYIRQALDLEPDNIHNTLLFSNLGTIQRKLRRYEQAVESYTYALNLAPKAIPILLNRATLYMEMRREEQARVDYSLVLDLDSDNQEALLMRAYILMQQRNYKEAEYDYKRLLELNPHSYNGRLGYATLLQKEAKYNEALAIISGMITDGSDRRKWSDREQAMLFVARAGIENDQQHNELALLDLEEAIKLDPNLSDIYLMRGQIYLALRRGSLAEKDFLTCVKLGIPMSDMRELIRQCK